MYWWYFGSFLKKNEYIYFFFKKKSEYILGYSVLRPWWPVKYVILRAASQALLSGVCLEDWRGRNFMFCRLCFQLLQMFLRPFGFCLYIFNFYFSLVQAVTTKKFSHFFLEMVKSHTNTSKIIHLRFFSIFMVTQIWK